MYRKLSRIYVTVDDGMLRLLTGRVNTKRSSRGTYGSRQGVAVAVAVAVAAMWNDRTARRGQSVKGFST